MVKYGKYRFINEEEVLNILDDLQNFKGELPWALLEYINIPSYLGNISDEMVKSFYDRKHDISIIDNPLEYIEYDLKEWIKENPEFDGIYLSEGNKLDG